MQKNLWALAVVFVMFGSIALAQEVTRPIGEAAFTIPAHSNKSYTFSVPQGAGNAKLAGHFRATGGLRDSIKVWVMNDDQFVNWRSGHLLKTVYNSERVKQGTLDVSLPDAGVYHVVFDNDFSVMTPKAVDANLSLHYAK